MQKDAKRESFSANSYVFSRVDVGADAHIDPTECTDFTKIFGEVLTASRADVGIPYKYLDLPRQPRCLCQPLRCFQQPDTAFHGIANAYNAVSAEQTDWAVGQCSLNTPVDLMRSVFAVGQTDKAPEHGVQ